MSIYFLFFEITCPKHSRWSVGKRFIIRPFRVWSTIHYTSADSVCYFLRWTAKWIGGEWSKKEIKRSGDGMTEFSHSSAGPSSFFRGRRNCYTVTSNNNGAISPSLSISLSLSFLPSLPLISNYPRRSLRHFIHLIYPVKLELTDIFGMGYRNVGIIENWVKCIYL